MPSSFIMDSADGDEVMREAREGGEQLTANLSSRISAVRMQKRSNRADTGLHHRFVLP